MDLRFKPWMPPNFAPIDEDLSHGVKGSVPIGMLSDAQLDSMVADWLRAVYLKADRSMPWRNEG